MNESADAQDTTQQATQRTAPEESHAQASTASASGHSHGYSGDKARLLARLSRIEGQVRGIARMIEDDKYCIDVLTQISATSSGLENVALVLLEDHLAHCVVDAARSGSPEEAEQKVTEAADAIRRLVKS
ncbi:metal-sensitive transcriptional regulator [Brevibacterium jeotgali]|uniref:DNA-binding transcriptional regulator, FrmR family n=1 Tax=Brevibacterium jeotgali TaxID=1262550 RepID=A0A2H1L6B2_9MICO|nr:metal-sensitive transcriptional regulator [Brevibacterium jeotgali]TWB99045.1 DNA-binding FrmR family transcriptional regulator [Brevibacterium jeotgali]SMY12448.1 DNA-binding transcriptional regulator, FrmR family [Brevibacterium jeotgali]